MMNERMLKRMWGTALVAFLVTLCVGATPARAATSGAEEEKTGVESMHEALENSSGIDPQDFMGTKTVQERIAMNRVFDDAAFRSLDEENVFDTAIESSMPSFRAESANPFQDAAQQAGQQGGGGQKANTGTTRATSAVRSCRTTGSRSSATA